MEQDSDRTISEKETECEYIQPEVQSYSFIDSEIETSEPKKSEDSLWTLRPPQVCPRRCTR